jgi:hypothetical protein
LDATLVREAWVRRYAVAIGAAHQGGKSMRFTEVAAKIMRQPVVNDAIAEGSPDDRIIRIETDGGLLESTRLIPRLIDSMRTDRGKTRAITIALYPEQ